MTTVGKCASFNKRQRIKTQKRLLIKSTTSTCQRGKRTKASRSLASRPKCNASNPQLSRSINQDLRTAPSLSLLNSSKWGPLMSRLILTTSSSSAVRRSYNKRVRRWEALRKTPSSSERRNSTSSSLNWKRSEITRSLCPLIKVASGWIRKFRSM